jgi:hypothetical protein
MRNLVNVSFDRVLVNKEPEAACNGKTPFCDRPRTWILVCDNDLPK